MKRAYARDRNSSSISASSHSSAIELI